MSPADMKPNPDSLSKLELLSLEGTPSSQELELEPLVDPNAPEDPLNPYTTPFTLLDPTTPGVSKQSRTLTAVPLLPLPPPPLVPPTTTAVISITMPDVIMTGWSAFQCVVEDAHPDKSKENGMDWMEDVERALMMLDLDGHLPSTALAPVDPATLKVWNTNDKKVTATILGKMTAAERKAYSADERMTSALLWITVKGRHEKGGPVM
jgi:hypothetical protein